MRYFYLFIFIFSYSLAYGQCNIFTYDQCQELDTFSMSFKRGNTMFYSGKRLAPIQYGSFPYNYHGFTHNYNSQSYVNIGINDLRSLGFGMQPMFGIHDFANERRAEITAQYDQNGIYSDTLIGMRYIEGDYSVGFTAHGLNNGGSDIAGADMYAFVNSYNRDIAAHYVRHDNLNGYLQYNISGYQGQTYNQHNYRMDYQGWSFDFDSQDKGVLKVNNGTICVPELAGAAFIYVDSDGTLKAGTQQQLRKMFKKTKK